MNCEYLYAISPAVLCDSQNRTWRKDSLDSAFPRIEFSFPEQCFPNSLARGDSFLLRKITTDPRNHAHINVEFPNDRDPKLKMYISELILGNYQYIPVESSWNVIAHGDARDRKWRGNCLMEWIASTLHTTSEHGVSSITTADAHTSAVSSRLNWRPRRFKWTRPFGRKTKSGFCTCAITFQLASTACNTALRNLTFIKLAVARCVITGRFWIRFPNGQRNISPVKDVPPLFWTTLYSLN